MKPFFSIIIPCCDVEPYVKECLMSVVNQPFQDWECIIGIEASKDKTEEVIRELTANDSRFRIFTGPRSGSCSASRNTGIDMAQGEYIIFLDGDDTIVEVSLQRLHDKIAARPGADLYPCAMLVYDDVTKNELEVRDNYSNDAPTELTGPEATLLTERGCGHHPCPMLQLTVHKRQFLMAHNLKCIHGLRRQDSEFSPRALYLAKRVVPLHDNFYLYRIRQNAVGSSAHGSRYFHGDWAIILKSLFAFHAKASQEDGFDTRVSQAWGRQWLSWLFFFWFAPNNVKMIPRQKRLDTLQVIFSDGFDDFNMLLKTNSVTRQIAGKLVYLYVKCSAIRAFVELFFRLYFFFSTTRTT